MVTIGEVGVALRQGARGEEAPVSSRAGVALILREAATGLELLFIHRAEHPGDPWSGQMGFPGGRWEPGDPDLRATAVRETAEEIGIDLAAHGTPLGQLDAVRAIARGRPVDLSISPFVFHLREPVETRPDPREVRAVVWLELETLLGPSLRSTVEVVRDGARLRLPCFRVDGRMVWGLSYRMFADLQERLESVAAAAGN